MCILHGKHIMIHFGFGNQISKGDKIIEALKRKQSPNRLYTENIRNKIIIDMYCDGYNTSKLNV